MIHELGHGLGMSHDMIDKNYRLCRKVSDSSTIFCSACANYQRDNKRQPIGMPVDDPDDCCNGFMGYYNSPKHWSKCSVREFEYYYKLYRWDKCMDTATGNQSNSILKLQQLV